MVDPSTQFFISLGAQIAIGVVGLGYQHLQFRYATAQSADATSPRGATKFRLWPAIIMITCGVLAWTPFIVSQRTHPVPVIGEYGVGPGFSFYATVQGAALNDYKDEYKALLIVRIPYANIDRMTDTGIDKSVLYTINGDFVRLTLVGSMHPAKLRISSGMSTVPIEYNVAVLPKKFTADEVKTLEDLDRLGGKVLATTGQTVGFASLGIVVAIHPEGNAPIQ